MLFRCWPRLLLPAILLLALALRLPVLRGDLWLDEVWSASIADGASNLRDLWADPRNWVDNNHLTLSAWMLATGRITTEAGPGGWWLYRLPSLLAGLATIALAHHLGRTRSPLTARLAALWVTLALPFTVYTTEARGYALALAAMFACLALLTPLTAAHSPQSQLANPKSPVAPLTLLSYWLLAGLGLLSHFTFTHALAGFLVLTLSLPWRRQFLLHAVPLGITALVYLGFIRHLTIAGGPPQNVIGAIAGIASLLAGGPWEGPLAYLTAGCVIPPFLLIVILNRRDPLTRGALAACAAALLTLALKGITLGRPEVVFPRYFLLAAVWAGLVLLLETARQLAAGREAKRKAQWLPFACITITVLIFSTLDTAQFLLRGGRGQYLAPLRAIASSPEPTLASDYDTRTQRLLAFYQRFLPTKIFYLTNPEPGPTRWYLANTATDLHPPPPTLDRRGATYRLRQTYPQFGPSGWSWYLYERQ